MGLIGLLLLCDTGDTHGGVCERGSDGAYLILTFMYCMLVSLDTVAVHISMNTSVLFVCMLVARLCVQCMNRVSVDIHG